MSDNTDSPSPQAPQPVELRKRRLKPNTSEYAAVHYWAKRNLTDPGKCEHCGTDEKKLSWANKTGQYLKQTDDWLRLCYSCHGVYDCRKPHCPKGHEYTPENTYVRTDGNQDCRTCHRERMAVYDAAHQDKIRPYQREYKRKLKLAKLAARPQAERTPDEQ